MQFLYFADLWHKKVILLLPSPAQTQVFLEEKGLQNYAENPSTN